MEIKMVAPSHPMKGFQNNAVFPPTMKTMGFQTAFFCKISSLFQLETTDLVKKRCFSPAF
ncbi:hypothetical protein DI43_03655 [Geobacillus sp. CAMR12739]|nr:hypothetical protein DI43_03655 [Geobacillus sp. CAMR12739]